MSNDDALPPAFVINLDRAADRWRTTLAECVREGVPCTRVEAVDGNVSKSHRVTAPCRWLCTPGTIGCALSHIKVWDAVVSKRLPAALVMEDDVRLVPGFSQKARAVLADMPADCDVMLLGCGGLCSSSPYSALETVQKALVSLTVPLLVRDYEERPSSGPHRVFVPELFTGTHCYVVTQRGARKLQRLHPRVWFHVDVAMASLHDLNVYATDPPLATQRNNDDSSITNSSFPKTLNTVLKTEKNGSLAYVFSAPGMRVAGVDVNVWLFLFAAMGRWPRLDRYVMALFLVELAVGGPSANLAGCLAAWALVRATTGHGVKT